MGLQGWYNQGSIDNGSQDAFCRKDDSCTTGLGFADDQRWLKSVVWPMAKKSALVFDDWKRFGGGLKLPQRGSKFDFVGNKYDENDKPMYSIETK